MKVKDIIKDDKFNEFLGYEIEAYNNRPAPQEGCAGIAGHRTTH